MYWDQISAQRNRDYTLHATSKRAATATNTTVPRRRPTVSSRPSTESHSRPRFISTFKSAVCAFGKQKASKLAAISITVAFVITGTIGIIMQPANDATTSEFTLGLPVEAPYVKSPDAAHLQFAQSGEPWSWLPYWDENVACNGCGLCSYTSAIDILTGSQYTPADMLEIRGDWEGMDAYTDDTTGTDGRTHSQWTKDAFGLDTFRVECSIDALQAAVSRGDCVAIVCTHGNVFMDNAGGVEDYDGHFVCVWGMDEEGRFRVHDSAVPHGYGTDVRYSSDEMAAMIDTTTSITVYKGAAA